MQSKGPTGADQMRVTFWGTRGTRMVARDGFARYGRHTICVEVQCGERVLVFDAGSGFTGLGTDLLRREIGHVDLFFTHSHYDHVEGIPFFQPFYEPDFSADLYAGRLKGIDHCREIVGRLMIEPYFPISQEKFSAKLRYRDLADHQSVEPGEGIVVRTTRLHHPGGANGYRVDFRGKSFALITDTEHVASEANGELAWFLADVDLFAYDCSYVDEEYPRYAGFGHSTWEEAKRLKNNAGAKRVLGLHHMPFRSDAALDAIAETLLADDPDADIARDGMRVEL